MSMNMSQMMRLNLFDFKKMLGRFEEFGTTVMKTSIRQLKMILKDRISLVKRKESWIEDELNQPAENKDIPILPINEESSESEDLSNEESQHTVSDKDEKELVSEKKMSPLWFNQVDYQKSKTEKVKALLEQQ